MTSTLLPALLAKAVQCGGRGLTDTPSGKDEIDPHGTVATLIHKVSRQSCCPAARLANVTRVTTDETLGFEIEELNSDPARDEVAQKLTAAVARSGDTELGRHGHECMKQR